MLSRRRFMGSMLFGLASLRGQAWAGPATTTRRIAAIDWPSAESLLALGAPPVAISDTGYFRQRVPVTLPESVADIGPFWEINLELLAALAPDAILANASSLIMTPAISEIARVEIVPEKVEGDRYRLAVDILQHAATVGGVSPSEADAFVCSIDARLSQQRSRLRLPARPILVALPDQAGRRAMVYGKGSLPDAVLTRLGLDNAWAGPVNANGLGQVGFDALMPLEDAVFALIDIPPLRLQTDRALAANGLWQALPAVRHGRIVRIDQFHPLGGLPSLAHFAETLVAALEDSRS